jgi:hypothetical protein
MIKLNNGQLLSFLLVSVTWIDTVFTHSTIHDDDRNTIDHRHLFGRNDHNHHDDKQECGTVSHDPTEADWDQDGFAEQLLFGKCLRYV